MTNKPVVNVRPRMPSRQIEHFDFLCSNHLNEPGFFFPGVHNSFLGSISSYTGGLVCDSIMLGIKANISDSNINTSSPLLESFNSIANLRQQVQTANTSGISVEAWITPLNSLNGSISQVEKFKTPITRSILSVGSPRGTTGAIGCRDLDFSLAQKGPFLVVNYACADSSRSCHCVTCISEPLKSDLTHIVVSLESRYCKKR